jgi:hypothetical protein
LVANETESRNRGRLISLSQEFGEAAAMAAFSLAGRGHFQAAAVGE